MVATLCVLSCVLAPAQAAPPPLAGSLPGFGARQPAPAGDDWPVVPRLIRAQELVYRGTFTEEDDSGPAQFSRSFRFENRIFVLDSNPQGADIVILTVVRRPAGTNDPAVIERIALETAQVDARGRIQLAAGPSPTAFAVPIEGPPTIETGAFVETAHSRPASGQTWDVNAGTHAPGSSPATAQTWQWIGNEIVNGTSCFKLRGIQQSADWERPRADRTAWRRQDQVWVAPRLGIAYRVERVIERREPARAQSTLRSILRYDLESSLPYPSQLFEDRRNEIVRARAFAAAAAPLLRQPNKTLQPELDALLGKIAQHLDRHSPTPYREAVLRVKQQVEAAKRGEAGTIATAAYVAGAAPSAAPRPAQAVPGQPAPDFLATDLLTRQSVRLERHLGRPVVLVFFNPTAPSAEDVLLFARGLEATHGTAVQLLGMSMTEEPGPLRALKDTLKLSFPLANGTGLRQSYRVEGTPMLVVIDAGGLLVNSYLGWGAETEAGVRRDVTRLLRQTSPSPR